MSDANELLLENLAALTLRVKEQEISIQYLLQVIAGLVNPDNPEHAYNYFRERERAVVANAPELSNIRSILETIDRTAREGAGKPGKSVIVRQSRGT